MSVDLDGMGAAELRRRVAAKEVSPVELTRRALAKAEATQETLNAFFVLLPEAALTAAKAAEDAVMRGEPLGILHGLPFSAKDLMAVAGAPYASGSRALANNVAMVDAPAVERARSAGAILIGKTTTSEFGCKPVGDSPLTGITRHPWNLNKTPGGSSAGAAASVAAGVTSFALGTDGGGSGANSVLLYWACRHQGPFWPRSDMADFGNTNALPRWADRALGRRCRARPGRDRRLRPARSVQCCRTDAGSL